MIVSLHFFFETFDHSEKVKHRIIQLYSVRIPVISTSLRFQLHVSCIYVSSVFDERCKVKTTLFKNRNWWALNTWFVTKPYQFTTNVSENRSDWCAEINSYYNFVGNYYGLMVSYYVIKNEIQFLLFFSFWVKRISLLF